MSPKQEIVSDAAFKAWPFSSDFSFACKDCRVTAAACKYYYPLVISPTITNCCKESHLKGGRVRRSVFENVAMHENSGFVWKPVFFFLLFWNVATFTESHCVFLCYFLQYEVFLTSLFDGCYHYIVFMDPVNGCSKSKLLVKE